MAFNPLDPNSITPPEGSFAAKLAARKARAEGKDANDTSIVDVSTLSESERAQLVRNNNIQQAAKDFQFAAPNTAQERVVIVFDDSGSMSGQKIKDAHEGITEFMRECIPNETAVKIAPLNEVALPFTCNLPSLALAVTKIMDSGGTPLYKITRENITDPLKPTRMILFSDGEPNNGMTYNIETQQNEFSDEHKQTIALAKSAGIPLDTCYIADAYYTKESNEYKIMKNLADETGGIFIVFEKGKCSFKHGFKYLTKGNRLLLMDASFKAALESGKV